MPMVEVDSAANDFGKSRSHKNVGVGVRDLLFEPSQVAGFCFRQTRKFAIPVNHPLE
jgi:hypothetical protein